MGRKINRSIQPLSKLTYTEGAAKAASSQQAGATVPVPTTITRRELQIDDKTIYIETDKDVYITAIEDVLEQKFINACSGTGIQVGTTTGFVYTNVACNTGRIGFDLNAGFNVTSLSNGVAKVGLTVPGNTPGGTNSQLQYNDNGTFSGIPTATWNGTALCLGTTNNISIGGGSAGQSLITDGSGALSWCSVATNPGGCSTQLQYNNGGVFDGISTATWNGSKLSLGSTSDITISGGSTGQVLSTDGAGSLSWGYSPICLDQYCSIAVGGGLTSSTGLNNITVGKCGLACNTTGANNIAFGLGTLKLNTTGADNIAIGYNSLPSTSIASGNIALGSNAGASITTGSCNTIIGSLPGSAGLACTVLLGAGTCERLKVDSTGLTINGTGTGSAITFRNVYETVSGLSGATGAVTHDFSLGSIFNHTSIAANFTVNITNLNLNAGYAANIMLVLNQGATAYIPNALQIAGVAQTIRWNYNALPTGTANSRDIVNFSITNIGGTYTVFGQLVNYG